MKVNERSLRNALRAVEESPARDRTAVTVSNHFHLALLEHRVFLFPRSLYRSYVDSFRAQHGGCLGEAESRVVKAHLVPRLKGTPLPYPECIFVEVADDWEPGGFRRADLNGHPTAMVLAYDDGDEENGPHIILDSVSIGLPTNEIGEEIPGLAEPRGYCFPTRDQFNHWLSFEVYVLDIMQSMFKAAHVVPEVKGSLPEKVLRKRAKTGKQSGYEGRYTIIDPNKSAATPSGLCGPGEEKRAMQRHWRRGHFKHRKSGTYWWGPCIVGNTGPVKHRAGYKV